MLFNSIDFGIFLPVVAVLYWTVFNRHGVRLRNAFLLACSWFFYGMWQRLSAGVQLVLLRDVGLALPGPAYIQLHNGLHPGPAYRQDRCE